MITASATRSTSSSRCELKQHVNTKLVGHTSDEAQHLFALHRIEAVGRLVEQYQGWIRCDCLGELDSLALARRHRADGAQALLSETELEQHIAGAARRLAVGQPAHLGEVGDDFVGGDVRRQ